MLFELIIFRLSLSLQRVAVGVEYSLPPSPLPLSLAIRVFVHDDLNDHNIIVYVTSGTKELIVHAHKIYT